MEIEYKYIDDDNSLYERLEKLSLCEKIGVDIETTGDRKEDSLDPKRGKIRLVQIANSEGKVLVLDWFKISETGKNKVKNFLEDTKRKKVLHNAKFDMEFLRMEGIFLSNIEDTMLLAGVLEAGTKRSFRLEDVVYRHLNIELSKEGQKSDWSLENLDKDQVVYAAIDAAILLPLEEALSSSILATELKDVAELEMETLQAIVEMELNGVSVDRDKLKILRQELEVEKETLLKQLNEYLGDINHNSHKQLKKAFKDIGIYLESTEKSTISRLAPKHKEIQALIAYKEVSKQLEFASKIPNVVDETTGRIYSNYFQLGTDTGRLSCTNFNLQQVPKAKRFRECFIPEKGSVLVVADYSQVQIRIAAEYSEDTVMREIYRKGEDLHRMTASALSGKALEDITEEERSMAKALNFGMMFGMGADSLVEYAWKNYRVEFTTEAARTFISKFSEKYTGFKAWQRKITDLDQNVSRTMLGRRRRYPNGGKYTQLINTPIQGTEGDILKTALSLLVSKLKGTTGKLVATVHDEIIVECKSEEKNRILEILKGVMEEAGQRFLKSIPVVVDAAIAESWSKK